MFPRPVAVYFSTCICTFNLYKPSRVHPNPTVMKREPSAECVYSSPACDEAKRCGRKTQPFTYLLRLTPMAFTRVTKRSFDLLLAIEISILCARGA